ncbi:MAG: sigma-70 family RNA polymerase sigma factor [Rhodospirillaceae bacterium]|nr:sigma-70 family RNA polymerase sigma factor [Rhodospirillaceae bacterium]
METQTEFRQLLIAALPHLRAYARSLTGSADQADDLVQDTAMRLLVAQEQYREGTNFRAWAIASLRNRFIDLKRRARFHGGSIDDIDTALFAQQASQETVVYFEQTAREFWRLSPAHREIITMIGINGMSYEQVAQVLGCPIGTVRSRLARARAELQSAIDGRDVARNDAARAQARPEQGAAPAAQSAPQRTARSKAAA